jgi:hypothetical protein
MRNKQRHGGAAVAEAALTLHRANFGLVVYKYPRPGVIHVFNKRFGSAPIALWEEPLPVEALQRAVNQFI